MMSEPDQFIECHKKALGTGQDSQTIGTAARTRPVSFEEIMLRRRARKHSNDEINYCVEKQADVGTSKLEDVRIFDKLKVHEKEAVNAKSMSVDHKVNNSKRKNGDSSLDVGSAKTVKRRLGSMSDLKLTKGVFSPAVDVVTKDTYPKIRNERRLGRNSRKEHSIKDTRLTLERNRDRENSGRGNGEKFYDRAAEKTRKTKTVKEREIWKNRSIGFGKTESKELYKPLQESSILKRKQSGAEHDERSGKSASPSPSSRRRKKHGEKGHEVFSSQLSENRTGRKDRFDIPSGSKANSGNYRKHGASSSGLGGYSPRKRRNVTSVVPSPPKRSPEKSRARWDIAPVAVDATPSFLTANLQLINDSKAISSNIHEVVSSINVTANSFPLLPSTIMPIINSISLDSIQLTQSTRPMRSLYLENLPATVSENGLMEWLNNLMISSGVNHVKGTQPCFSCTVHKEKGQAVVELLTPEDAVAALSFNGASLSGAVIAIRRPKDYVGPTTGEPEKSVATTPAIRDHVVNSPHKIFVGGISRALSSKMFMEIASTFGSLKAFQFEKRSNEDTRHAFLEYVDQSVTAKACAGLNGMKLAGHVITALKFFPSSSAMDGDVDPRGIPEHAKALLQAPTHVLSLTNMLPPESLASLATSDVDDILEDVRLECARFGTVKAVNLVRLNQPDERANDVESKTAAVGDDSVRSGAGVSHEPGSVFVEFARVDASCMASHSLHGRLFDGRLVSVAYASPDTYRSLFPS